MLNSSFANEFLAAQPMVISQVEYSLPFIQNIKFENEQLCTNETSLAENPFLDFNDLEDYLKHCERKWI